MKGSNKKIILSILTSATVAVAGSFLLENDFGLSFFYRINQTSVVDDNNIYASLCGEYDEIEKYLSDSRYSTFSSLLVDYGIEIPLIDQMVPQGLTIMDEYILITMYDYARNSNSIICTMDFSGELANICYLENDAHVGGIAYDEVNNLVWVPQKNGKINAYLPEKIVSEKNITPIYSGLDVGEGLINYKYPWLNSIAFLTVNGNKLFVGSFSVDEPGLVKEYTILVDKQYKVTLTYERSFKIPNKCQGISFYEFEDIEYIAFSRSYGEIYSSLLQLFTYEEEVTDYSINQEDSIIIKAPSMMEQIVFKDDYLYTIYESGAECYLGEEGLDNLCVMDAKSLVKLHKKNTTR